MAWSRARRLNAPSGGRRRLRAWLRWGTRLVVGLLLTGAALALWAFFVPVSFPWLDGLLRSRWRQATGLELEFQEAQWSLSRGFIRVERPTLAEAGGLGALLGVSRVEIDVDLRSALTALWRRPRRVRLERVSAYGPALLEIEEREGRLSLSEPLERLYELLKANLSREGGGDWIRLELASLEDVTIRLSRRNAETLEPFLEVRQGELQAEFEGDAAPRLALILGALQGREAASRFTLKLRPRPDHQEIALELSTQAFDSDRHLLGELTRPIAVSPVRLAGLLRREDAGRWGLHTEATLDRVTLPRAGAHGVDQTLNDARVNLSLTWDPSAGLIRAAWVELRSEDCDLKASGQVRLARPYAYGARLAPLRLSGQSLALAERAAFGESHIVNSRDGRLELNVEVTGNGSDASPESVVGSFLLEGVDLRLPRLTEPLKGLRLRGEVNPAMVVLHEGAAQIEGIPVSLRGSFEGVPTRLEIDRAEIEWASTGEVARLSEIITPASEESPWRFEFGGRVATSGKIAVDFPDLSDWGETLARAEITGGLLLEGAELRVQGLDPPIRELAGSLDFSRQEARLRRLAGRIEDVAFVLDGRLTGPKLFFEDTAASLTLQTQLSLARLPEIAAWFEAELPPEVPPLEGRAVLRAGVEGPLRPWSSLAVRGDLAVEDLRLTLDDEELMGPVHVPRLELDFEPRRIAIRPSRGRLGEVDLRLSGAVSPDAGEIEVALAGNVAAYRPLLPRVLGDFERLAGEASVLHRWLLRRAPEAGDEGLAWPQMIERWRDQAREEDLDLRREWGFRTQGQIYVTDGTFLHLNMPEEAIVTEAYAHLQYDDDGLWSVEPFQALAGRGAEGTRGELRVQFGKGDDTPILNFKVLGTHANLSDWIRPWRPTPDHLRKPPRPRRDPSAEGNAEVMILADVELDHFTFREVPGRDLRGRVTYENFRGQRGRLVWEDVRGASKEGFTTADGRWFQDRDRHTQVYHFTFYRMNPADLLQAAFEQRFQSGVTTGFATGEVHLSVEGTPEDPFIGEGRIVVENSQFTSNPIFRALGRHLSLEPVFNDITFSRIEGAFQVHDHAVWLTRQTPVIFESPSALHPLRMEAVGRIGPENALNLLLSLQFFPLVGDLPLIGEIWKRLTERIVRFEATGTLEEPRLMLALPLVPSPVERARER